MKEASYIPLEYYVEQVKTCILIGLMCVNPDPNKRPTAWADIVEMLNESHVTNRDLGLPGRQVHGLTLP